MQKFSIRSFKFLDNNGGQSLIEILVAVAIGAIMITAAAGIITPVLKVSTQTSKVQAGMALARELLDNTKVWAEGDWHNISALATSSLSTYFLNNAVSPFVAVTGTESVVMDGVNSGLIGYWKLDEAMGTKAYDFSGNNNLGTWYGTGNHHSSGNFGYAGQFNGADDYVSIPVIPSSSFTWSAWIKVSVFSGYGSIVTVYSPYMLMDVFSNAGNFWSNDGLGGATLGISGLSTDTWYQMVFVRQGDSLANGYKAYLNGALTGQANTGIWSSSNSPWIGGRNGIAQYFNGLIDDVRVYDRALSADEIKTVYQVQSYSRYFYVDDVYRDTGDNIVNSTSGAVSVDPSTKQITVAYNWPQGITSTLIEYVTRNRGGVFDQTDWSGGSGQDGPVTSANGKFATSSLIDNTTTTGSIYVRF